MQLVLVELCEFSKDLSLLFFGQARSAVLHLHAEDTHGIRAELVGQRRVHSKKEIYIMFGYKNNKAGLSQQLYEVKVTPYRHCRGKCQS